MKKLGRVLLLVLASISVLGFLILIGVNMYVQSQGTQARIQQELSQRLGTTLRFRRISLTPWGGLKLSGITIPQSQPGVTPDFLTADTFRLRVKFSSLFSERLVIKEISLIKPQVVWAQNKDGKWRVPSTLQEPAARPHAAPSPSPFAAVSPTGQPGADSASVSPAENSGQLSVSSPAISAESVAPIENERSDPFTPEVRRVNLALGRFVFLDEKLKNVATFDQVRFRSGFRAATELGGDINIEKTSLRDRFFLEQLHSPIRYSPDELDFSQITASAGGGEVAGRFTLLPQAEDSPFTVSVRFRNIQADRIIADAGGARGMVTGRLEGFLDAGGTTADPNSFAGAGEIVLRDGEVQQYSLLVALGQLLQIDELRQLHFDQAQLKYHINPGIVTIDEMIFRSANIRLSATGTVSFEGKLKLESQLAVSDKIRAQLFRAIRDNFQPIDEAGYSAVNFQVTGTVGRPRTNLMDKLIGRDLKDLGSVLNSFIGGGKSDDSKKKKPASEPSPGQNITPGSPESSPSPTVTGGISPEPTASP